MFTIFKQYVNVLINKSYLPSPQPTGPIFIVHHGTYSVLRFGRMHHSLRTDI